MEIHKWKKIINIIYLTFILGMVFLSLFSEVGQIQKIYGLPIFEVIKNISFLIFRIITKYYFVTFIYISCLIYLNGIKYKIDKTDLAKEKNYYRDKIKEYSPGVLSYVDNYIVENQTLIATIMYLELKGLIKTTETIKATDLTPSDLDLNTSYVYSLIKNNNLVSFDLKTYNDLILLDCSKKGLIVKQKKVIKSKLLFFYVLVMIQIFLIFLMIIFSVFKMNVSILESIDSIIETMMIVYMTFVAYSQIVSYIISRYFTKKSFHDNYRRTDLGMELNTRLNGLDNFLKDFSNLSEGAKNSLILWEEYLLYSVMFDHNNKVIADYQTIIDNTTREIFDSKGITDYLKERKDIITISEGERNSRIFIVGE